MRRSVLRAAVVLAAVATWAATAAPAHAHEGRRVGRWNFVVGWGEEPSYSGFKNSIQLRLTDAGGDPVVDLGDTLKVEVIFGDRSRTLTLEPNFRVGAFGDPGDYRAWISPTRPGTYTFRFTGTIEGDTIDERFTSGEETFDGVSDVGAIQFPEADPNNAQLNERLAREVARVTDDTDGVRMLTYVAIGIAGLAALLAILSLSRHSRG